MFRRFAALAMLVLLGLCVLALPACATTEARPSALTGDNQTHERHATGIDSQINDR